MIDTDLTTDEVAAALRLHRATVQRWLKAGRLKGYQMGRSWRVPRAALEAFRRCERGSMGPAADTPDPLGSVAGYEEWEKALLAEEDLAAAPPLPAEALRREKMYEERG